jgi:hypothetical protein
VSACCCTWCQRRGGGIFSVASRWKLDQIKTRDGDSSAFTRTGEAGGSVTMNFCPHCGSTVVTELSSMPGVIGIPVGCFADPTFPAPQVVVWCDSKAAWMNFPPHILQLRDQTAPDSRTA